MAAFWGRGWKTGRRVRTPVVMQLESADCGAACLGIVLAHFGRRISLEELRESCKVGRDGSSLLDISDAAARYDLEATGWRREIHQLPQNPMPVILFWGFSHFVVLEGIGRDRYYLNDPATGHRVVDHETFDRDYTGVALTLRPTDDFEPGARSARRPAPAVAMAARPQERLGLRPRSAGCCSPCPCWRCHWRLLFSSTMS